MQYNTIKQRNHIKVSLIALKVLAVAGYFGTVLVITVIWYHGAPVVSSANPISRLQLLGIVSMLVRFVMVPALLVAAITGALLVVQSPGHFLRMRWWQIKIITLLVGIPAAHFFMSSRLEMARQVINEGRTAPNLHTQFGGGLWAILVITVMVIWLGRFKPRLKQA